MQVLGDTDPMNNPTVNDTEQICWNFAEVVCVVLNYRSGTGGLVQAGIEPCFRLRRAERQILLGVQMCRFCSEFWPQPSTASLETLGD